MAINKVTYPTDYKISEYLTYYDGISYNSAKWRNIDNTPTKEELKNITNTAKAVYDPICKHFGKKIPITTFFRNSVLNKAVGGVTGSQHLEGTAIDMDGDIIKLLNADIFMFIAQNLDFDQLIWEKGDAKNPGWIHVSFVSDGSRANRKRLTLFNKGIYKHTTTLNEFLELKKNDYK